MSYYVDTMREIAERIADYFDRKKDKQDQAKQQSQGCETKNDSKS